MADAKYTLHNPPPPPPERRPLTPPPPPQGRRSPPPPPTASPGYKAAPPPQPQGTIRRPPAPPQEKREIDWRTIVALAAIALVVAGAYGGYSYWKYARGLLPREDETKTKLVAMLPAYVKVDTLKVKSTDATTFQYEATASPLEDLYASEVKRPDLGETGSIPSTITPPAAPSPITLLKRTSKQGEPLLVYGKILANKSDDLWHVSDVTIDSGLEQLGRPRSAFIADATVEGTPEAIAAIAKLDTATTEYKGKVQALIAQQSTQTEKERREALAAAEKGRQEASAKAQAAKAQLDAAITAGNAYRGVLMFSDGQTQEILFSIAEHTGLVLKAEAMNPDNPQQKQSFAGTILSETSDDPDSYPITFSPVARQNLSGAWDFYNQSGVLKLRPSSDGLEGTCQMQPSGWGGNPATYKLKLQKVDPATVVQILNPPAPVAANSQPIPTAQSPLTNSLNDFLKTYWQDNLSNDAAQYAAHFAPQVDYCYQEVGKASRDFVQEDRAKLIKSWPIRTMTQTSLSYTIDGQNAKVDLTYLWKYSGAKGSKNGTCNLTLGLIWDGVQWAIISYSETVGRQ